MARSKTPTAKWPTASLMRSLARAGWSDVLLEDRACRAILRGLVDRYASDESGVAVATLWQIGDAAGYRSKFWISRALGKLEESGIITWERGGIVRGKHVPSHFTVIKTKLVELIYKARKLRPAREAAHYAREAERIQRQGYTWGANSLRKKKRRSDHGPQNGNHLSPIGGVNTTPPSRPTSHLDGIGLSEAEKTLIVRQVDAAEASAHASAEANRRNKGAGLTLMADAASSDGGPANSRAEWLRAQLEATSPGMGKAFDRARAKRRRPWSPR